ncbi:MAG: PilZ domain-containing protein [bacterium]
MKIEAKQRDFTEPELDFQEIHDVIFPADVRETDLVSSKIRKRGEPEYQVFRVWKLSPLGIELLVSGSDVFEKGELVDIELTVGRQSSKFEGMVVGLISKSANRRILGVRFSGRKDEAIAGVDRRKGSRWLCSSQFDPVCIAPNPAQFNDFLYFQIRDISGSGIRATTSLRNKFIVPGMELELQISFPVTSQISTTMRVVRVTITTDGGKDLLEVGLAFTTLSMRQREVIGQYLVQFSDAESLERIRKEGFFPLSLTKGIDYQYIKSADDFSQVLELRLRANREVGKVPDHYTAADMADLYDNRGRIIVGKFRGIVVGTVRLTFPEVGEPLEHEEYLKLPDGFPRRGADPGVCPRSNQS